MADSNSLTVQNGEATPFQFQVVVGTNNYTQQVAGGGSWVVPTTIPCDQWFTVTVSDSAETLSYKVLNATTVIFAADTLACPAGACEGGCQVNEST